MAQEVRKFEDRWQELAHTIASYEKQLNTVLPNQMDAGRMMRVCYNVVKKTPKLLDCTFESFMGAMLEAAYLGLEPSMQGQCWLIPYGKVATFVPGYKGLVQLCLRSDQVSVLYAEAVFENDYFVHTDFPPEMKHQRYRPLEDSEDQTRGGLKGAYSVARMRAGTAFDTYSIFMDAQQIMAIKLRSKGATSKLSPWNSDDIFVEAEMWKKTVLRRHCKVLPMSVQFNRIATLDDQHDTDEPQHLEDNAEAMKDGKTPDEVLMPDKEVQESNQP